jgi:hypothetical protein
MPEAASPSREAEPEELGLELRKRLRRLQLRRVHPPVLAWIIVCWVLTAAALAVLFSGALSQVAMEPGADGLAGVDGPGWYRLLITVMGAAVAGALVVLHATPRLDGDQPRVRSAIEEVLIAVGLLVPVLVLVADRAWMLSVVALAAGIAVEVLVHRTRLRIVPGLLMALVWLLLTVHVLTPAGQDAASWTWIVLPGLGAAVAAFGAYYGVARAAETRTRAIRVLFRERWNDVAVLVVVLVAAAIAVLRLTIARELFPEPDPALWSPWSRHWSSWLLAALVVGVLVVVSVRSTRRPLLRVGQRRVTLGLALLGNLQLFAAGLVIVIGLVLAIVGAGGAPGGFDDVVPWLKVVGVTLLGLAMLLPALAGTAARWLGIVAALFLIPNTLFTALSRTFGETVPTFAPTPVQVLLLLVAAAIGLAVRNLFSTNVRPSLVVRFAVVPLIAVHAGWLLPAVWSQFGLIVGAVLLVLGVLLLQPPAARDNATHTARSLASATTQLFGFGIALLAAPSLLDDPSLVVLGLVWLSVVVVAALCIETVARDPEPESPPAAPDTVSRNPHPA